MTEKGAEGLYMGKRLEAALDELRAAVFEAYAAIAEDNCSLPIVRLWNVTAAPMIGEQDVRGPTRGAKPSQQAFSDLCRAARRAEPPPRQGPAEGHGGACPRARRRAGGGGYDGGPVGRGSREIRGSTPCKANCPCTSAGDVGRGQG